MQLPALGLVLGCALAFAPAAAAGTREYWIAAEEVAWDYAPSYPFDPMRGEDFSDEMKLFLEPDYQPGFIGHIYTKALFRQYTADFGKLVAQPSHLGLLGPVIRGVVGDTIVVHFRNNTSIPTSIHPHGVLYAKDSEGSPYTDSADDLTNTAPADDAVPPGTDYTYTWSVPERAGPGAKDPSSIAWPYHSHTNETGDVNAGLVGFIVITRKNAARDDGTPKEVDREFFTLFTVFDENSSSLAAVNGTDSPPAGSDPDEFAESNLMHGINGLVSGNDRGYDIDQGDHVRWYLMGMGTEVDMHTVHWHGITVVHDGHRKDVVHLAPATTETVDFVADNPGTWMLHCHVNDHIAAGMMTKFTIRPD
jgi:FtsP/CotA-like multicopper oxidase with cupredoxin domain